MLGNLEYFYVRRRILYDKVNDLEEKLRTMAGRIVVT